MQKKKVQRILTLGEETQDSRVDIQNGLKNTEKLQEFVQPAKYHVIATRLLF